MGHIKLKASKEIKINFNPKDIDYSNVPSDSKKKAEDYIRNPKAFAEHQNYEIMMLLEDRFVMGYEYLFKGKRRVVVEINPVTIFFSNAVMSSGLLEHYKNILISQSPDIKEIDKSDEPINLTHSGMYFQLAINCIINLQAALECFANSIIPEDFPYKDKDGNPVNKTITFKLYNAIPEIRNKDFKSEMLKGRHKKYNKSIDKLIQLRNLVIHLKPSGSSKDDYKRIYRNLLDFEYEKAILSVKKFINFYELGLIEECSCGKNLYFFSGEKTNPE